MKIMPENQMWRVGAQNDGLFIINAQPRPSNDDAIHDREDGPTLVLNVTELPLNKAQAICDAHNSYLKAAPTVDSEPVACIVRSKILNKEQLSFINDETRETLEDAKKLGMQITPLFTYQPDAAAKIAQLESALASHKPIFDMLSGIDDVDTTPQEGDTSFVCIMKELIANERQSQKDKAVLVKALELAKVTFIANKMDVRNVMEVINEALTKVKGE